MRKGLRPHLHRRPLGRAVFCCWVSGIACAPAHAGATLAQASSGASLHWQGRTIDLTLVKPEPRSGIAASDLRAALLSGIDAWNTATRHCLVPRLRLLDHAVDRAWLAEDGRSLVMVRDRRDCESDDSMSAICTDESVAARTHLHPRQLPGSPQDGLLEEADMEISAIGRRWSMDGSADSISLRRMVTHELGHVLGLAHPCRQNPAEQNSVLPLCQLTASMSNRLMHPAIAELSADGLGSREFLPDPSEVEELCQVYGRRPLIQWLGIYWPARENEGWIALFLLCSLAMAARTILRRRGANG